MPLNPPPTIATNLGLIVQPLIRSDMSREAQLTFAVGTTGTPSPTLAQSTIDTFQTAFHTQFQATFDSEVSLLPPTIRLGDGGTTPFEAIGAGAIVVGGRAGSFVPPNVAVLFKKRSSLGGKANRGRSYFPFFTSTAEVNENGSYAAGVQAAFSGLGNGFVNLLISDSIPMVIAHRVFNVPLRPHFVTAIHFGPLVTSMDCESMVATQRRRLGR